MEGVAVVVARYGHSQQDAVENSLKVVKQTFTGQSVEIGGENFELLPGDVIVKVFATEIVWTDTIMATGQYQHRARVPYTPGMTFAGTVAYVSPSEHPLLPNLKVGDPIAVGGVDSGPRSLGRYQPWGGCATYAVAPQSSIRFFPANKWTFAEAASFMYGYDTAYHCLVHCGNVCKGETILIQGATGGVGIPAVRLCRFLGLRVIACTRTEEKVRFLKETIGAHDVIVTSNNKSFSRSVKELTAKKSGVDIVYDGVGGDDVTVESMKSLRFGGRLLIVGWAATPNVGASGNSAGPTKNTPNRIPTNLIMMKGLQVIGCPAMIAIKHQPALLKRRINDLTKWILTGSLPPPIISTVFSPTANETLLDCVKGAFLQRAASGAAVGSTVVEIVPGSCSANALESISGLKIPASKL